MKKSFHKIVIGNLLGGYELALPVHKFISGQEGPTLGLIATIHGDESIPIEVLRRFAQKIDALDFKGQIVILPVANPPALGAFTRTNPIDSNDLNRVFPGSEKGWLSEQIADAIAKEFLPEVDYLIDFHSGGAAPTVEYTIYFDKGIDMARAFGQKVLYKGSTISPKSNAYYVENILGKPVILVEAGGGANNDYYIRQCLKGIENVMILLGMMDGQVDYAQKQTVIKDMCVLRPRNGGIFVPSAGIETINTVISKEDVLGEVYSPYTFALLETFHGIYEKNMMLLLRPEICEIEAGDFTYILGNMDTAEEI